MSCNRNSTKLVRWPFFIVVVCFNSSKSWLTTQTLAHTLGSQTWASVVPSDMTGVRLLRSRPWTRWSRDRRSLTTCVASAGDVLAPKQPADSITSWFECGELMVLITQPPLPPPLPLCLHFHRKRVLEPRRRRDGIVPTLGSSALASPFFSFFQSRVWEVTG